MSSLDGFYPLEMDYSPGSGEEILYVDRQGILSPRKRTLSQIPLLSDQILLKIFSRFIQTVPSITLFNKVKLLSKKTLPLVIKVEKRWLTFRDFTSQELTSQDSMKVGRLKCSNNLSVADLRALAKKYPKLLSLSISNVQSYNFLSGFAHLRMLDFSGCLYLKDNDLQALRSMPHLELLSLSCCLNITGLGLAYLQELPRLESLNLSNCNGLLSEGVSTLPLLKSLKKLDLHGCSALITQKRSIPESFLPVGAIEGLKILNIASIANLTDRELSLLSALHGVTDLDLSGNRLITDSGLSALLTMSQMKKLKLDDCIGLTDVGISLLHQFKCLSKVNLSGLNRISDECLSSFRKLTAFEVLDLSYCARITDRGVGYLLSIKDSLRGLDLEGCRLLTNDVLAILKEMKNLRAVNLIHCPKLTDGAVRKFKEQKSLLLKVRYVQKEFKKKLNDL